MRPVRRMYPNAIEAVSGRRSIIQNCALSMKNALYKQRTSREWGLVEWVRATCQRFHVDVCLVEKAATGISVA
jgi:hypothetical protein